jgi:hypothetical protein
MIILALAFTLISIIPRLAYSLFDFRSCKSILQVFKWIFILVFNKKSTLRLPTDNQNEAEMNHDLENILDRIENAAVGRQAFFEGQILNFYSHMLNLKVAYSI